MPDPSKRARGYSITLYTQEAAGIRDLGHGNLSAGVRKAWRARSTKHRAMLDALVTRAIEADDLGEPVTAHLLAIQAHLAGTPRPSSWDILKEAKETS